MKYILKNTVTKPSLYSENDIVTDISGEFVTLSGYSKEELTGKSLAEVSCMLKLNSQICLEDIKGKNNCFMFTKENEPREVNISCKIIQSENEKNYFFKEKVNPRVENKNMHALGATLTDITELYNKDIVIKYQKNELESIIENMPEMVYVIDRDLNITASSRSIREFINIPDNFNRNSDLHKNLRYYYSDGNLIPNDGAIARRVFRGEYINDLRITAHKDEKVYYLSFNGSPIKDKDGNVEKAIISARNITEQVEKDKLIKEQNDMLNAIIENISEVLVIIDKNGQYEMSNKVFRNLYSISESEPMNPEIFMKKFKLYDEDRNIITLENLPSQRILRGEKFSQYRIDVEGKNGFIFHTESSGTPIYDSKGKFIAGVVVTRNINDWLKNEENKLMKAQYDMLRRTIENLQLNFILFKYPDIKIEYMNRKAFKYLREFNQQLESIDSCIGKSIYEAFNYDVNEKIETDAKLKELINNKVSHFTFTRKLYKEGKENYVKVMFQPLYNLKNEVKEVAIIGTDITEEILAKNKIEEASKLQGEIFINVSHELKTPLNVIFSSTQLMEMYINNGFHEDNKEKIFNNIKIIKQNCNRFIRLINNILDTSKIKSGFLELSLSNENIVEVVENIAQSVSEYIKAKGININFDTNTEEKYIACDANKIERIMLNLISNAVKFSNKGNNININVLDKNDVVEISVRDTGIGIDKKDLDSIFNIYYQVDRSLSRNAEGTGIGLSLVKSFVEIHDGKISVESEVGKGTIFKIELPSKTIKEDEVAITTDTIKPLNDKIEMINVEFSDIYLK
ncbi:MAG: ATP-binding protein [Sedimentibacter sp.]|uniref:PAS domain-containing sensor histidine kinase n=1 Tax=Sedimentibacter sp. TaxID=1960295 RepID=UPI002981751B|nr:ATP-binding protein [Sedimentibacter sp.]MDW5299330.1 ATP-binding protein [Sedimentibacter sp.]